MIATKARCGSIACKNVGVRADTRGRCTCARDGRGRFVILYGQGGIGRSSLLRAAMAESHGAVVLDACASELERGYGFGVVRQLLEAPIAGSSADERQALLDHAGPAAVSALGIATSEPRASGAGFDQIEAVLISVGSPLTLCK